LIKNKLNSSQYSTMHQLDEDVELMLENARIFNGEGLVVDAANVLGKWWTEQRGNME
jgi:transcription initiation factor TFIID subunit 2